MKTKNNDQNEVPKKYVARQASILLDKEVKPWLYRKAHVENRTLSNVINTILKREKEREERSLKSHQKRLQEINAIQDLEAKSREILKEIVRVRYGDDSETIG